MSAWITVFDVAVGPFRWGNAGEGLVAIAIMALGVGGSLAVRGRSRVVAVAVAVLSFAAAGIYVERTLRHRIEHARCVEAVRRGEGRVVEGVVNDYRPGSPGWSDHASFRVDGESVTYPVIAEGCGFHEAALKDASLLRDGVHVRLRSWQGQILQLSVKRP